VGVGVGPGWRRQDRRQPWLPLWPTQERFSPASSPSSSDWYGRWSPHIPPKVLAVVHHPGARVGPRRLPSALRAGRDIRVLIHPEIARSRSRR
jgi:hypothetical protein